MTCLLHCNWAASSVESGFNGFGAEHILLGATFARCGLLIFRVVLLSALAFSPSAGSAQDVQPPSAQKFRGFMVPTMVVLRATTQSEERAHAVWTLRAALNVAALQCQFSPFLRTVKNYNDILRHHSQEFRQAQTVMLGHFRRYDKNRALNSFDQYTTKTYNSFSTLDAQYAFCDSVAVAGREVLRLPRNGLGTVAPEFNRNIRTSLMEPVRPVFFNASEVSWHYLAAIPEIEPDGRKKRKSQRG